MPRSQWKDVSRNTKENKKIAADFKKWARKLKRYRNYDWKPTKIRDPRTSQTAVHIRSQYQIDKYGLHDYIPADTIDDDDELD